MIKRHSTQFVTAGLAGPGPWTEESSKAVWRLRLALGSLAQESELELILFHPSSGSTNNVLVYSFEHENSMWKCENNILSDIVLHG